MRDDRIMAKLRVADVDMARTFYTDFLGLTEELPEAPGRPPATTKLALAVRGGVAMWAIVT